MFTVKLFFSLTGCGRNKRNATPNVASLRCFVKSVCLFSALLLSCAPFSSLHAEEKSPAPTGSAEGLLATTEQMIEHLILQIDKQKESHPEISQPAESNSPYFTSIPNIKPVNGHITSEYGMRMHPVYKRVLFHHGIDFAAPEGTRVHSTGDGVVSFSGYERGYGQKVTISHGYGFKTIYAHLSRSLVRQGQRVSKGEIIAFSGNTGVSTGPHLHYEIHKDNVRVNPAAYFFDNSDPDKFLTIQKPSSETEGGNS
ncbi:MAG: M23 family metallopeptidase [Chlorobium sp.]|uniref:M23 family metallopeptidase n=1 Tax=Chlorobium sp. TaxID=1095 RepID=UPI002F3EC450